MKQFKQFTTYPIYSRSFNKIFFCENDLFDCICEDIINVKIEDNEDVDILSINESVFEFFDCEQVKFNTVNIRDITDELESGESYGEFELPTVILNKINELNKILDTTDSKVYRPYIVHLSGVLDLSKLNDYYSKFNFYNDSYN